MMTGNTLTARSRSGLFPTHGFVPNAITEAAFPLMP
jgi:hypothetical protein